MSNKTRKKIAVITGTRAEYGILKPLMEKISSAEKLDLQLIATGMHLLKKYGRTIDEIKADGFQIAGIIKMYDEIKNDDRYHALALSRGLAGFTNLFFRLKPDIIVVFGDRLEPLAAALAAAGLALPIAHIHGGDKTDSGHIDESIRHAISRFSHLHFAATADHRQRLLKMGEEPWRVFKVGALGLDSICQEKIKTKEKLFKELNLDQDKKTIICVFHPLYTERSASGAQMREIIKAIKALELQTIIIYPNNDAGGQAIIKEIKKAAPLPFIKILANLTHNDYISLLEQADALIGNSSSGIIEAPMFNLPVVNIGLRNVGREHAENIIFTKVRQNDIIRAIKRVLHGENFKKRLKKSANPYGDGKTSARIVGLLSRIRFNKKLLLKKITY